MRKSETHILESTNFEPQQLTWVDFDFYPNSKAKRIIISCKDKRDIKNNLIKIFEELRVFFDFVIGMPAPDMEWGQLCIDTWDIEEDSIVYAMEGKSQETIAYLNLLLDSNIPFNYTGICECKNWPVLLSTVLDTVIKHSAPYSPLFYSRSGNLFFYFHHSGDIGIYYLQFDSDLIAFINKVKEAKHLGIHP